MIKNSITHNYQLPKVYRILVVDDKLGKEENIAWRNCFKACVKAKAKGVDIEIDYSKSVDDGFSMWLNNSYDMVLIDYDFTDTAKDIDAEKFELSTIFPNRAGAGLFRFIRQLIEKNEDYKHKKHQKIYIWTSHDWDKKVGTNQDQEGVSRDFSEGENSLYKKKIEKNDSDKDKNNVLTLDELSKEFESIDHNNWTLEYVLERLVSLTLSKNKNYRLGGYVAFKKNGAETNTLYSPLVDKELKFEENQNGYLYLLPDKPEQGDFTCYCSIDRLQITRKLKRRLNGNDLRKALYGKEQDPKDKTKLPEENIRHSASLDKNSQEIKKKGEEYKDFSKFCGSLKQESKNNAKAFAGVQLESDIWLAATPLTMVTRAGENGNVINLLLRKLEAFFDIGIGAAVLKTTYLKKDNNIEWPKDHIQRHHRTRVFDPSELTISTEDLVKESSEWYREELKEKLKGVDIKASMDYQLWNAGKTALESFPPKMINGLLNKIFTERNEWKNKIIVSLGSKYTVKENWEELFKIIFTGVNDNSFPLVEINVRHFMRPLMKEYLGGDEYLSPMDKNKIHNYSGLFFEFSEWLKKLHLLGTIFRKKIILKFPFRSDIIPFLRIAEDIAEIDKIDEPNNYGISGVTLINTVKSPYPYRLVGGQSRSSVDSIKIPQMSGEFLVWIRNYLLQEISQIGFRLPVSVSGGVGIAEDDIDYIRKNYEIVKSIQIGTYFLKRIDSEQIKKLKGNVDRNDKRFLRVQDSTNMSVQMIHFKKSACTAHSLGRCGACYNSYYCDVFLNRGAKYEVPLMDITACTGCGLCVQNCISKALQMKPANEYLILCCGYSDSRFAILRDEDIPFIHIIHMETPNDISEIKAFIKACEWEGEIKIDHAAEIKVLNKGRNNEENAKVALEEAYWRAMYRFYNCRKPAVDKDEVVPLEDCVYLGIKTYLKGIFKENGKEKYDVLNVIDDLSKVIESLKKYDSYKAITAFVCVKKNKEIEGDVVETKEFVIRESFKNYNDQIQSYSPHGKDKAGGIDILGHGSILFGDLSDREEEVMTFAGLPIEAIKTVKKLTGGK